MMMGFNVLLCILFPLVLSGVLRHDDFEAHKNVYKNPGRRTGAFRLTGTKWNKTNLSWSLESSANPRLNPELVKEHLVAAMEKWAAVTPLTFHEVDANSSPDIVIKFAGRRHFPCPQNFETGALAHAYFPSDERLGGDIHFDRRKNWVFFIDDIEGEDVFDFQSTVLHELGHSLGLEHSDVREAVMWEEPAGPRRELHPDDIAGIQKIYGPPSGTACPTIETCPKPKESDENVFKCVAEGKDLEFAFQGKSDDMTKYKEALSACLDLVKANQEKESGFCNQPPKFALGTVLGCLAESRRFEIVKPAAEFQKNWNQAWDLCSAAGGRLAHVDTYKTLLALWKAVRLHFKGSIETMVGGRSMGTAEEDWIWMEHKSDRTGIPMQNNFRNFTAYVEENYGEYKVYIDIGSNYVNFRQASYSLKTFLCEFRKNI